MHVVFHITYHYSVAVKSIEISTRRNQNQEAKFQFLSGQFHQSLEKSKNRK